MLCQRCSALLTPGEPASQPQQNLAFEKALKQHTAKLSAEGKKSLSQANATSVEELIRQAEELDKKSNEHSFMRRRANRVRGVLRGINRYLDIVGVAIQHNPDISALVLGGCKLVLMIGIQFTEYFERIADILQCITDNLDIYSDYSTFLYRNWEPLQEVMVDVYGNILQFCDEARNVFSDNQGNPKSGLKMFAKSMWQPFEQRFVDIQATFERLSAKVQREAARCEAHFQHIEREKAESERQAAESERQDGKREKAMSWLSPAQHESKQKEILKKRCGGTGQWFLDGSEFKMWKGNREAFSTIWCHGIPGSGKSILTSIMINDLEQTYASARETVGIAYFYFDYKTKADQSPSKVIAALIKQLCLPRKELHPSVEKLYNQYSAVAVANMDIQELEKLLAELCMDFSKVFIVIDALDECEKPQRSELIQLILRARTPKVRILATSRNEPDIWVIFQDEAAILNIKPHRDDIDAFVRAEVEKSIVEGRLSLGDPGLKEIIIKKLTGGAQGMFLWVYYQIRNLCEQTTDADIEEALDSLPKSLSQTYMQTLEKIESQDERYKKVAKRTLLWIVTATRPLLVEELIEAIAVEPGSTDLDKKRIQNDPLRLLSMCGNLITIEHRMFRPAHYSVQQFLAQHIGWTKANITVGETCLTYLLFKVFENGPCGTLVALEARSRSHCLMNYAVENWATHVSKEGERDPKVANLIARLLDERSSCFLAWLEAFHCLEQYYGKRLHKRSANDFPLRVAAWFGLSLTTSRLLERGDNINRFDRDLGTALTAAVSSGNEELVSELLRTGATVDENCNFYGTALHLAAEDGSENMVQMLLQAGCSVAMVTVRRQTALHKAAGGGHAGVVRMLLDAGSDVHAQSDSESTPLYRAARSGSEPTVSMLIAAGSDVNARTYDNWTPLHEAARNGSAPVVQVLVNSGADPSTRTASKQTPLDMAKSRGYAAVIGILEAQP